MNSKTAFMPFMLQFLTALEKLSDDLQKASRAEQDDCVKKAFIDGQLFSLRTMIGLLSGTIETSVGQENQTGNPFNKEYMRLAAQAVQAKLPDNHGFILLVSEYGENGRLYYMSTMERTCAVNVLKEFLLKGGAAEDWMKHIE
jgi:hypothetical protein